MPTTGLMTGALIALSLMTMATGCTESKPTPTPTAQPSPSATPPPVFTVAQVKNSLLKKADYGKEWNSIGASSQRTSLRKKQIEACIRSRMSIPGDPQTVTNQFSARGRLQNGANHAELFMLYPDAEQAKASFDKIVSWLKKCKPEQRATKSPFPQNTKLFLPEFDGTWTGKDDKIGPWVRVGGFENAEYRVGLNKFNVTYTSFDYALRGNLIASSIYWQALGPKESPKKTQDNAEKVLAAQLDRIG